MKFLFFTSIKISLSMFLPGSHSAFHLQCVFVWDQPTSDFRLSLAEIWTSFGAQVQTRLVVFADNSSMEKVFRSIHMCFGTL